jgi:hypothetical protein
MVSPLSHVGCTSGNLYHPGTIIYAALQRFPLFVMACSINGITLS